MILFLCLVLYLHAANAVYNEYAIYDRSDLDNVVSSIQKKCDSVPTRNSFVKKETNESVTMTCFVRDKSKSCGYHMPFPEVDRDLSYQERAELNYMDFFKGGFTACVYELKYDLTQPSTIATTTTSRTTITTPTTTTTTVTTTKRLADADRCPDETWTSQQRINGEYFCYKSFTKTAPMDFYEIGAVCANHSWEVAHVENAVDELGLLRSLYRASGTIFSREVVMIGVYIESRSNIMTYVNYPYRPDLVTAFTRWQYKKAPDSTPWPDAKPWIEHRNIVFYLTEPDEWISVLGRCEKGGRICPQEPLMTAYTVMKRGVPLPIEFINNPNSCESGWEKAESNSPSTPPVCYKAIKISRQVNYKQAKEICFKENAVLPVIRNSVELQAATQALRQIFGNYAISSFPDSIYLGLRNTATVPNKQSEKIVWDYNGDVFNPSTAVTPSGGILVNYDVWKEPMFERCMIWVLAAQRGQRADSWHDWYCDPKGHAWEWPVTNVMCSKPGIASNPH